MQFHLSPAGGESTQALAEDGQKGGDGGGAAAASAEDGSHFTGLLWGMRVVFVDTSAPSHHRDRASANQPYTLTSPLPATPAGAREAGAGGNHGY